MLKLKNDSVIRNLTFYIKFSALNN